MKRLFSFFFILILFSGCTKSKHLSINDSKDSVFVYMQIAQNQKIPYEKRVKYTKKAVLTLAKQNNDSLNSENFFKMTRNFHVLNSWKNLKETSYIALERSRQKKDDYFIGQSYKWLGIYYENISCNDSAFYYFSKAEKKNIELNKIKELCEVYIHKGLVQYYVNDYQESLFSIIKALKIAKRFHYTDYEYDCYMYIQMNLADLHDYKSALDYCNKSLLLIKRNPSVLKPQDLAFSLKAIGFTYFQWGKTEDAIKYYKLALLKSNHAIRYPCFYSRLQDDYAQILIKTGSINNVEKLLLSASKTRDSLNIDHGKNYNKLYFSEYYQITNQIVKAQQYAHEAYTLSKSYRNASDMLACLKQLSAVDPRNALKYSQEYIEISDSMQQLERVTRNKFAKIAYETEEITTEKNQAIQQKWVFMWIAVLLLVIGALVVVLLMQRNKQKELRFLQAQQITNEEIYQLIQNQQTKIDEVRQIEKKRIAQDLHDGIMNRLASTRLNLHVIAENPSLESMKKCLPFIDGIQDIEKEIRNIAHDLNSNVLAKKTSFIAVIEMFIEEQKKISNRKYHLEIDTSINWEMFPGFKKIHLFRILQEAVQNIDKHAQAKNVIVSILKNDNFLLLEIFDDGNGFSLNRKKKGIGLQNIYSRAKSCKGSAEIKTKVNEGTTVIVRIPI